MKPSRLKKLDAASEHHRQIDSQLADPEIIQEQMQYKKLGQEYAHLDAIVKHYKAYCDYNDKISETEELLNEPDDALRVVAQEEIQELQQRQTTLEHE